MEHSHRNTPIRKKQLIAGPSLMELMNSVKKGLDPQHYFAKPLKAGRRTSLVLIVTVSIRVTQYTAPPPVRCSILIGQTFSIRSHQPISFDQLFAF
jgi:hypothetical protein